MQHRIIKLRENISTNLLTNPVETEIGSNKYKYVVADYTKWSLRPFYTTASQRAFHWIVRPAKKAP